MIGRALNGRGGRVEKIRFRSWLGEAGEEVAPCDRDGAAEHVATHRREPAIRVVHKAGHDFDIVCAASAGQPIHGLSVCRGRGVF